MLAIPRLLSLSVQDCRFAYPFAERPDVPELTWGTEVTRSRSMRLALRFDLASRPAWPAGYARRIRCLVVRPYAGRDDWLLSLKETAELPDRLELLINLKLSGEREVTAFGVRLRQGDSLRIGRSSGEWLCPLRRRGHGADRHASERHPGTGARQQRRSGKLPDRDRGGQPLRMDIPGHAAHAASVAA
jgi:hypothetical protein